MMDSISTCSLLDRARAIYLSQIYHWLTVNGQSRRSMSALKRRPSRPVINLILRNDTTERIEETEFGHAFPPCKALPWKGECSLHVHMVKFDPICVGWNYMSGARHGRKVVFR